MISAAILIAAQVWAASPAPGPGASEISGIEVRYVTHAGEGAEGTKFFGRDGCYRVESRGSPGGGGDVLDRQAGCHLPADVAPVFRQLDAMIGGTALIPESKVDRAASKDDGRFGSRTTVILSRNDGTRWAGGALAAENKLVGIIDGLPSENQWHAPPPAPPTDKGPQVVVVSASRAAGHGRFQLEGSLTANGRWWCYSSEPVELENRAKRSPVSASSLDAREAQRLLGRILEGVRPLPAAADENKDQEKPDGPTLSVQVAFPGAERRAVQPARLSAAVAKRFTVELQRLSPVCKF